MINISRWPSLSLTQIVFLAPYLVWVDLEAEFSCLFILFTKTALARKRIRDLLVGR